jgi:hypothetical protein
MRRIVLTVGVLVVSYLAYNLPTFFEEERIDEAQLPLALRGPARLLDLSLAPRLPDTSDKVRGPCTFLNTAANHGLLPYSGKGITIPHLQRLVYKMGLSKMAAYAIVQGGVVAATSMRKSPDDPLVVNLDQLNTAEFVHAVSLFKMDALNEQDDLSPNATLVDGLIEASEKMSGDYITQASISEWRRTRYEMEKERRGLHYGWGDFLIGISEGVSALHVFGEGGKLRTDIARSIFLDETFPKGWQPHLVSTLGLLGDVLYAVMAYYLPRHVLERLAK